MKKDHEETRSERRKIILQNKIQDLEEQIKTMKQDENVRIIAQNLLRFAKTHELNEATDDILNEFASS